MKKIIPLFAILLFVTACVPAEEMEEEMETEEMQDEEVLPEETEEDPAPTPEEDLDPTEPYLSWNLTSTDSLDYFPEISAYAGDETIKGWLFEVPVFGTEEMETLFAVSAEDMERLPPPFQDVTSYKIDEEILTMLADYDETNPATVRVTAIRSVWEAAPVMTISKVL